MRKIIHLSDLHIGYGKQDLARRFNDIIGTVIIRCSPPSEYVVVITGDIVEDATLSEHYNIAAGCLKRLEKAGFTVLVVPGNHDYGTGSVGWKKYVPVFKECFFGDSSVTFPKLDIIDEVAFIGLDSMAEELHWYDRLFAEGEIGTEQLRKLDALLHESDVAGCTKKVVYLHHHPFDPLPFHELKDSGALGDVLAKHASAVDALLYGHNHAGKKHAVRGIARSYDAGSSTRKNDVPSVHRIIDLSRDAGADIDEDFLS